MKSDKEIQEYLDIKKNCQKVCGFTRVSVNSQLSGLEKQIGIIDTYVSINSLELKVDKLFQVIGNSKKDLLDVIEYCNKNKCDLVVSDINRLTRNMSEFVKIKNLFNHKIHIINSTDSKDVTVIIDCKKDNEKKDISLIPQLYPNNKKNEEYYYSVKDSPFVIQTMTPDDESQSIENYFSNLFNHECNSKV